MFRHLIPAAVATLAVACGPETSQNVGPTSVTGSITTTLAVSIHALYSNQSATVRPSQECDYRADATGGTTPYTYQWTWSGLDSATNAPPRFLQAFVDGANFNVKVQVTDAVGDTAVANKSVTVASTGIVCP